MLDTSFATKTVMMAFAITVELSIQDIFDKTTTLGALEHIFVLFSPDSHRKWDHQGNSKGVRPLHTLNI